MCQRRFSYMGHSSRSEMVFPGHTYLIDLIFDFYNPEHPASTFIDQCKALMQNEQRKTGGKETWQ